MITVSQQLPTHWTDLQKIHNGLNNAALALATTTQEPLVFTENQYFPLETVINRVSSLKPFFPEDLENSQLFVSIAKKLSTISEKAPAPQQTCLDTVSGVMSNCLPWFMCTEKMKSHQLLHHYSQFKPADVQLLHRSTLAIRTSHD